jgi:hypothetical protein
MTRQEKILVNRYLRTLYHGVRNIRHEVDGAVTCTVDRMPGTHRQGRIFAGWDRDLLREASINKQ